MMNLKKFGFLEIVVILSAIYVLSTLIWTASTRSAVEEKANIIKGNHKRIVDFVNSQINTCEGSSDVTKTSWGELCNESWTSEKIISYINSNLNLKNPYSKDSSIAKSVQDPRIQAEGKAGQSTEMGIIFISSSDFDSAPGSEWIIGTCVKSPCVAAGNNELTSVYR